MVDVTAPSAAGNRVSSREYLENLRARRLGGTAAPAPVSPAAPVPTAPSQPIPSIPNPTPIAAFEPPSVQSVQQMPTVQQPTAAPPPTPPAEANMPAPQDLLADQPRPKPEQTAYEWTAASRPFKKRNRQFYTTVGLITGLISLILFFAGQFLPIAVVISIAFLGYVLSSVPPERVTNKITTYGVRADEALFYWDELGRFWFEDRYGEPLVNIETARFPGRITLLMNPDQKETIEAILSRVLLQEKPKDTFIDKSAKWLQEKIPLDVS